MINPDANVFLIRHSESRANVDNHLIGGRSNESDLSENGERQAIALGAFIARKELQPSYVYASPAIRTLKTAYISLKHANLDLPVNIDNRLQELSQGGWTGCSRSIIYNPETLARINQQGKDFRAPDGESMNDVGKRMFNALNDISSSHELSEEEAPIIYVYTHGLAIRCFASYIHNWSHERTYKTDTPNASISHFTKGGGKWRLQYLGRSTQ